MTFSYGVIFFIINLLALCLSGHVIVSLRSLYQSKGFKLAAFYGVIASTLLYSGTTAANDFITQIVQICP